jgi:hypothetical protein
MRLFESPKIFTSTACSSSGFRYSTLICPVIDSYPFFTDALPFDTCMLFIHGPGT